MSVGRRRALGLSWGAMAMVLVVALAVGSQGGSAPPTDAERAQSISEVVRCPTCRSQSIADSDAPAARQGRDEILRLVGEGLSDAEVKQWFVDRFGTDILLDPPKRGVSALVWALPVVSLGAAAAGLVVAFKRWRPGHRRVSDSDRALVERALDQ
ncbi:MAG: cytochrome c-type biogenesis protein CcmH [Actinomycetota bacterium]